MIFSENSGIIDIKGYSSGKTGDRTGGQFLISGERRNAFKFKKIYNEIEVYNAWKKAYIELLEQARTGQIYIIQEQEQILKILNKRLEGFEFYENF